MKKAEYPGNEGCPQRDSAEHEEYAGARSADRRETEEADGADLLERILDRNNLVLCQELAQNKMRKTHRDEVTA